MPLNVHRFNRLANKILTTQPKPKAQTVGNQGETKTGLSAEEISTDYQLRKEVWLGNSFHIQLLCPPEESRTRSPREYKQESNYLSSNPGDAVHDNVRQENSHLCLSSSLQSETELRGSTTVQMK